MLVDLSAQICTSYYNITAIKSYTAILYAVIQKKRLRPMLSLTLCVMHVLQLVIRYPAPSLHYVSFDPS